MNTRYICGLFIGLVPLALYFSIASAQVGTSIDARKHVVDLAADARRSGRTSINLKTDQGQLPIVETVRDACSFSTVGLAILVDRETVLDPSIDEILTWYKFSMLETLCYHPSAKTAPRLSKLPEQLRPLRLLPITGNEIIVQKLGGSIAIDGVTVTMTDREFAEPQLGKKYLIFVSESEDHLATFEMGPASVYEVIGDHLSAFGSTKHPVVSEINNRFRNSFETLKSQVLLTR